MVAGQLEREPACCELILQEILRRINAERPNVAATITNALAANDPQEIESFARRLTAQDALFAWQVFAVVLDAFGQQVGEA